MTEHPAADDLTDRQVADIARAGDAAAMALDELAARNPSAAAVREQEPELTLAVRLVQGAYTDAGVSEERADRAATVWLIQRLDPRACLDIADTGRWRQPGDAPGGLGQR